MRKANTITTQFSISDKPQYTYVEATEVRQFILGQISNPIIKAKADIPGSVLHTIITNLEKRPLFIYNGNKQSRFVFSSWYGVLDLRKNTYANSLLRDLYLLHELNHMATIQYQPLTDEEWIEAHIRNEKASSMWSEALVYFEHPELFVQAQKLFGNLWVKRYYTDEILLIPGKSNHQLYNEAPLLMSALLLQEFVKISVKPYVDLSSEELRTRKYDYFTESWCDANACIQQEANNHMQAYLKLSLSNPTEACNFHKQWLEENTSLRGVLFDYTHPLRVGVNQSAIMQAARDSERSKELQLKYSIPMKLCMQGYLQQCVDVMEQHEMSAGITQTPLVEPTKKLIREHGICNTVYALFTQPAREVASILYATQNLQEQLFTMAQSRKQDHVNQQFAQQYIQWTQNVVAGLEEYPHFYPTAGSSEALRASIVELSANARKKGKNVKLHIFQGEYEGAPSYAAGNAIEVVQHRNRSIEELSNCNNVREGDLFYISYASSIEGNRWENLNQFLDCMHKKGVKVLLDLTYLGCFVEHDKLNLRHLAVECVYVSLSKAFGVYYQRVGGMFSKNPSQLLFGNKWFKNMFSINYGIELMKNYPLHAVPNYYRSIQENLILRVNQQLGLDLKASDVFLLANQQLTKEEFGKLPKHVQILCRKFNDGDSYILRVCLQPMLDYLTNDFRKTFPMYGLEASIQNNKLLNTLTARL